VAAAAAPAGPDNDQVHCVSAGILQIEVERRSLAPSLVPRLSSKHWPHNLGAFSVCVREALCLSPSLWRQDYQRKHRDTRYLRRRQAAVDGLPILSRVAIDAGQPVDRGAESEDRRDGNLLELVAVAWWRYPRDRVCQRRLGFGQQEQATGRLCAFFMTTSLKLSGRQHQQPTSNLKQQQKHQGGRSGRR